jgi:ketosteroid isomerase-like protein
MTEHAGDFEQFMQARERAADAYVNGDPEPVDALATATARLASDGSTVEMPLRITEIFRREGSSWRLIHRHADPLRS